MGAGLAAVGGGCLRSSAALLDRADPKPVSMVIRTTPADFDAAAMRIARFLAEQLKTVGITVRIRPMRHEELLREVLINHNFDLYVTAYSGGRDPDFLRTFLHSKFAGLSGWQNPFGYTNLNVDELLEAQQHQRGGERQTTLNEIQHALARDQPFTVIAFPDVLGAVRTGGVESGADGHFIDAIDFLSIDRHASSSELAQTGRNETTAAGDSRSKTTLRVAQTDPRPTLNLNPLSSTYRKRGTFVDILYDSIGRWIDGELVPWLADSWTWTEAGSTLEAEVTLRDGLTWHDGEPLTASDVAFTFEFLGDTSLGTQSNPIPAPTYRHESTIVSQVEELDDHTLRFRLEATAPSLATSPLSVPILPAHVWQDLTGPATFAGINAAGTVTDALVWNNLEPVGSGPLKFRSVAAREELTLERNDDHFLHQAATGSRLRDYGFPLENLTLRIVPSGAAALSLMKDGVLDAIRDDLESSIVPQVGRARDLRLAVSPTRSFYHLGFNVRRQPFGNPHFRRAVAQLLDKAYLVESVLGGYGHPATSPLARHDSIAPRLRWTGRDRELPFVGDSGDLDVDRAKAAFRDAGYHYTDDGRLRFD